MRYCLFDNVRQQYFRHEAYIESQYFGSTPGKMSRDLEEMICIAARLSFRSEWEERYTGPMPELVVEEFEECEDHLQELVYVKH